MKPRPSVWIVVLNWNGLSDTRECLRSLAKAVTSGDRVLVIDNGSRNHEAERLKQEVKASANVIALPRNLGFTGGCNLGIKTALEAGADYILLLNNDTVVDPSFLRLMVDAMENNPKAGLASPMIMYYDRPATVWFGGGQIDFRAGRTRHLGIGAADRSGDQPHETEYVTGCAMLISRKLIAAIGVLDPVYFAYFEDVDYCLRARRSGFSIILIPSAKVWHKISRSTGGEWSARSSYLYARNQIVFMLRYAPPRDKARFMMRLVPRWMLRVIHRRTRRST